MPLLNDKDSNSLRPLDSAYEILMRINETESSFRFAQSEDVVIVPIGYDLISTRYFRHTPPTYDDIEYAINYIEDEIEKAAAHIPSDGFYLATDMKFIRHLAVLSGLEEGEEINFKREELERLFGQYAEIAMGRHPYPDETDISTKFYAQLLIFREYMHHLKFERVLIK